MLAHRVHRLTVAVATIGVLAAACRQHPEVLATSQPASVAPFVASSPHNAEPPPRRECWMIGRFDGVAVQHGDEMSLIIPRGWIAVTRDNDKQWDDLHLVVEVSAHPPSGPSYAPLGSSVPVVLSPTVDSAGPQLTTWQLHDTLRLFVPWKRSLEPRWLVFALRYQTLSYKGEHSNCTGTLGTDTLRFFSR
jgi:hypothetical protein